MVMAENDELNVNGGGPKSPWKTPVAAEEGPVNGMGAESWPALADAHRTKNPDVATRTTLPNDPPPPLPPQVSSSSAFLYANKPYLLYK